MFRYIFPLFFLALASCASTPSRPAKRQNAHDACLLLEENSSWKRALRATEKKWGTPASMQLAFIFQESSFQKRAAPRRKKIFGVLPGFQRVSSAYGYAQATKTTWDEYQDHTGNDGALRWRFRDASDFIGWYTHLSKKKLGLRYSDTKGHYLAYFEGRAGYARGNYRNKKKLIAAANRVHAKAQQYKSQLKRCR